MGEPNWRAKAQYHAARSRERAERIAELEEELLRARAGAAQDGVPPVYGVTRYSIFQPKSPDWRLSQADAVEYRDRLWAPERMEPRQQIFLEWAVPVYQRFHERHGYRHIVQHSPDLPDRWLDPLRAAAEANPALVLDPVGGWKGRIGAIRDDLRARGVPAGPLAWVRVDDDDLLAADYLDRLLPLVTLAHDGFAVSFGRGFTARYTGGALADFGVTVQAMVSMGLAFVGHHDGTGRTSFPSSARSHAVLHRHLPTVLDSRQVSYLRLLHGQQDRDVGRAASDPTQTRVVPDLDETLAELFPTVVGASDTASGTTGEPQAPFAR